MTAKPQPEHTSSKTQAPQENQKTIHDPYYKRFFSIPQVVNDFLKGYIPNYIIGDYTPESFTDQPTTSVNRDFSERREDKIWRVATRQGTSYYIYLLFEFQSTSDKLMALRILEYSTLFIQNMYTSQIIKSDEKHPPVLPIVIYSGSTSWTAATSSSELCIDISDTLKEYQPTQKYILIDISKLQKDSIIDTKNLASIIFRLEKSTTVKEFTEETIKIGATFIDTSYDEFYSLLTEWVCYKANNFIRKNSGDHEVIEKTVKLLEIPSMLEEALEKEFKMKMKKIEKETRKKVLNNADEIVKESIVQGIKEGIKNVENEVSKKIEEAEKKVKEAEKKSQEAEKKAQEVEKKAKEGANRSIKEEKERIIKKMLSKKLDIDTILDLTGFHREDVLHVKNSIAM